MNKAQFLADLKEKLALKMNEEEVYKTINYYEGYIDEAMDFGLSEEEAINQLGSIDEIVNTITIGLKEADIDINKREIMKKSDSVSKLSVDVFNTSIDVVYGDYNEIEVFVSKKYETDYLIKTENDTFVVSQISTTPVFHLFGPMSDNNRKMVIHIPWQFDLESRVKTSNATINIKGNNRGYRSKLNYFYTKNAAIKVEDMDYQLVVLETKNAKIYLNECNFNKATVETTNAKVSVEHCDFCDLKLTTTNAKIFADRCDFGVVDLKTTNAKVELNNILARNTKIQSTNGKIICKLKDSDATKEVSFYTTNGKVTIDRDRFIGSSSQIYRGTDEIIHFEFDTTNASIELINFKN